MLTVQSWGGLGDTLRNLSLIPHAALHRRTGWRMKVRYLPPDQARCLPEALPPGAETIRRLVERCPSLQWDGIGPVSRGEKIAFRGCRELLRLLHGGRVPFFPTRFRLTEAERTGLPVKKGRWIGVQTHLRGMPTKRWPVERWREVLGGLLEAFPGDELLLFEPAAVEEGLIFDPRLVPVGHLDLAQAMDLIGTLDFLLSVDSWSKYVAAWDSIPQLIIVPEQRADYAQLTPSSLWKHEFAPLRTRQEIALLGLKWEGREPVHTFGAMENLTPEIVLEALLPMISSG